MNKVEYLLTCLSEESGETSQETAKCQRFGLNSSYPGQSITNKETLHKEILDFIAVAEMLVEEGIIEEIHSPESLHLKEEKKEKVKKYMSISKKIGTLN